MLGVLAKLGVISGSTLLSIIIKEPKLEYTK